VIGMGKSRIENMSDMQQWIEGDKNITPENDVLKTVKLIVGLLPQNLTKRKRKIL